MKSNTMQRAVIPLLAPTDVLATQSLLNFVLLGIVVCVLTVGCTVKRNPPVATQLKVSGDIFGAAVMRKDQDGSDTSTVVAVALNKTDLTELHLDAQTFELSVSGIGRLDELVPHKRWRLHSSRNATDSEEIEVTPAGVLRIGGTDTKLHELSPIVAEWPAQAVVVRTIQPNGDKIANPDSGSIGFCLAWHCGGRCACCTCFHRVLLISFDWDALCGC